MTQPTPADAKARRLVRLPDGRVGHLLYAPAPRRRDRTRAKVNVGGRHVQVPATELQLLECQQPATHASVYDPHHRCEP